MTRHRLYWTCVGLGALHLVCGVNGNVFFAAALVILAMDSEAWE